MRPWPVEGTDETDIDPEFYDINANNSIRFIIRRTVTNGNCSGGVSEQTFLTNKLWY